jgi:hypothetical protein
MSRRVVRVLGRVLGQVVPAVDDGRHDDGADADWHEQQSQVHERDRESPLHAAVEEVHRAREGDRQERGDQ